MLIAPQLQPVLDLLGNDWKMYCHYSHDLTSLILMGENIIPGEISFREWS
jgi:hypothetical protein